MNRLIVAGAIALSLCAPSSSFATTLRTFVSMTGNDANPCSLTQPCRTIAQAVLQTSDRGEVVVLDSGGYGFVQANTGRGMSITSPPGVYAGVTGAFLATGVGNPLTLRGLTINGKITHAAGALIIDRCVITGAAGQTAVYVGGGETVLVKDTLISGANIGIEVDGPSAYGTSDGFHLTVNDSVLNGVGYGIAVTSNVSPVKVTIADSRLIGIDNASGTGLGVKSGGAPVRAHVANSLISRFAVGVSATKGTAPAGVSVATSELTHNGFGVWANNQGTITLTGNNNLIGNSYVAHVSGGAVISGGTNFHFYNDNEALPPLTPISAF